MTESINKLIAWSLVHCYLSNCLQGIWRNDFEVYRICILGFDRYYQIVLHRGWASLHSHQQYVRASVSLTFIHMVLSKFLSVSMVVLICISLIMEKIERIFICWKVIWNSFPRNCLVISFAYFRLTYWSFSYRLVGVKIVAPSFHAFWVCLSFFFYKQKIFKSLYN